MATSDIPYEVDGYQVLLISLPPLPAFPVEATHYLYVKRHEPRIPEQTTHRSLYLANVPFDSTEHHMKHLFSVQLNLPAGRIEDVRFEDSRRERSRRENPPSTTKATPQRSNPKSKKRKRELEDEAIPEVVGELPTTWDREIHKGGSNAVIVFVDRPSMEAALGAIKRIRRQGTNPVWEEGMKEQLPPLGYQRYLNHEKLIYPPKEQLLKSVDDFMTAFAAREAAQARVAARQRQQPDEDGFVKVTKGGRTGSVRQEDALKRLEKQTEKRKVFDNFYRFQSREQRKEKAMELLKKFESDKEKIRKMKAQRGKFRPEK